MGAYINKPWERDYPSWDFSRKSALKPQQTAGKPQRTKVFVSYSHADKIYLERLQKQLKPHLDQGKIQVWDDTRIPSGSNWRHEIETALSQAKVAILLVSVNFLASNFIGEKELPALLDAARNEGATILPVILNPIAFQRTKLAEFQTVNDPSRPLNAMSEYEQDLIWVRLEDLVLEGLKTADEWYGEAVRNHSSGQLTDNAKALAAIERALAMNPQNVSYLQVKGGILYHLNRSEEAVRLFQEIIHMVPDKLAGYWSLARCYKALNREQEARAILRTALGRVSDISDAEGIFSELGHLMQNLGQHEEALALYEQATQVFPENGSAYFEKGMLLVYFQHHQAAVKSLEQAIKLCRDGPQVYLACEEIIKVFEALGDRSKAEEIRTKQASLAPSPPG